jgi:hypothetical protein
MFCSEKWNFVAKKLYSSNSTLYTIDSKMFETDLELNGLRLGLIAILR